MQERFSWPWLRPPHPGFPGAAPLTRGKPPGFMGSLPDLRPVTLTLRPFRDDGTQSQDRAGGRVERSRLRAPHWDLRGLDLQSDVLPFTMFQLREPSR